MHLDNLIVRVLAVVDRTLRREFPDDYDKRCMYAAFGMLELLKTAGVDANILAGDFVAFVVSASGTRAGLQGFGFGSDQHSHFWVETSGILLDVGPHYLPRGSSFPAASIPFVAWRPADKLPSFLRYRVDMQYHSGVQLASTREISDRMANFLRACRARYKEQKGQPKLPHWLLTDQLALDSAAKSGDFWARNAIRFEEGVDQSTFPF